MVFFVFGMVVVQNFDLLTMSSWVYAALSLTAVRIAAVAISLIGAGLRPASVIFMSWFGPRGLASIVLGLILVKKAALIPGQEVIEGEAIATVLLSIVAYGFTTNLGIRLYTNRVGALPDHAPEREASDDLVDRFWDDTVSSQTP